MLAAQILSGSTQKAPKRRVPDRRRLALRNWRVVGDKLCSLVFWGPLHNAVSSFLQSVPALAPAGPSPSGSSTVTVLDATAKAKFYKDFISAEPSPERLSNVKGIPEIKADECQHEARYLKGGGNGHMNWVHCAKCLTRWKLPAEMAAKVTGRKLQQEAVVIVEPKGKAKAKASASNQIEDMQTAGPMEADYIRVIENQKDKIQHMQAQLELLTGTTDEIDMAAEACTALEGSYMSMDPTMQREAQTVVTEFRRLKTVEEDSRARSKHFPTKETKDEWIAAADSLRVAAIQMNSYYQNVMRQRAQISALLLRSGQ